MQSLQVKQKNAPNALRSASETASSRAIAMNSEALDE
jgi:hypothetical protein